MGKIFTRHKKGSEGGDCTAPYSVTLHGACTVRGFIEAVLRHNTEWGYVNVFDREPKTIFDTDMSAEYRYGKLVEELSENGLLDREIKRVSASGGWTRMDYYLYV